MQKAPAPPSPPNQTLAACFFTAQAIKVAR